ncbi:MAG: hypothetical protein R2762_15490 [Bryobacteraceae bacterium]
MSGFAPEIRDGAPPSGLTPKPAPAADGMPAPRVAAAGFPVREALFAAGALAAEISLWTLLGPAAALAGHAGASAALAFRVYRVSNAGGDFTFPALLALTVAVSGPFGAGGTLLCLALRAYYARRAQPVEQWLDELLVAADPAVPEPARPEEIQESQLDGGAEITALIDVIEVGDELQKQAVVSLVTRSFRPSLAPVLRRALSDPSNAIRVQAATAMARIEGGFLDRAMDLDRRLAAKPNDLATLEALARLYDDYAFTGILDPVREQENQRLAIQYYRRCLEIDPNADRSLLALGRLLVRARDWEEADRCLAGAGPAGALWRLETLSRLGRFQELEQVAASLRDHTRADDMLPLPLREAVALWAGETAA